MLTTLGNVTILGYLNNYLTGVNQTQVKTSYFKLKKEKLREALLALSP